MFIGVRRSEILRGPLLYLLGGWVPASVIAGAAAISRRCSPVNPVGVIFFTALNAGALAAGFTVRSVVRSRSAGAKAPGFVPIVLGVLISAVVSAVPLLLGLAAYEACIPGKGGAKLVLFAFFVLPFTVIVGGISSIPGCYVGVSAARAVGGGLSPWALAGIAAGSALGLLWLNLALSASLGFGLLLALPLIIFLLGNLWACVSGFAILGNLADPGLRRSLLVVGAVLSAAAAIAVMWAFGGGCGGT